jgi:anti-anti-sigma factor
MLTVRSERTGDFSILKLNGRIVRGQEIVLESAVLEHKLAHTILLDLSDVQTLDAGGLTLLVSLHRWAESKSIQLKLVNPRPFVYEMLTRTHLDCVFDISTFDHALAVLGCECRQAHAQAAC